MTASDRARRRIGSTILLLSAVGWVALLVGHAGMAGQSYCQAMGLQLSTASFRALLTMNPVSSLATGWALMLIAMMLPTLIAPILHVHERSFKHRRFRSVALFAVGYAVVWMAAGAIVSMVRLIAGVLAPQADWPAIVVGLIALIWQCSPLKQLCLNRSHNHVELAAFGLAADLDALKFGITHGAWCVGSCWALMLFSMLMVQGHVIAMVAVTIVMVGERLERPRPLAWRLRGPDKLLRMAIAQTRLMYSSRREASC